MRGKTGKSIAIFENQPVRRVWDEGKEKWYFSVVDIVRILTDSQDARTYWKVLKHRLTEEGSNQTVTNCNQLKLIASDGKLRLSDVADTETMFRIIQSIPSPKAEPFKLWLAKVGYERLKETADPELALNRAREHWLALGRPLKWIEQRMRGQEVRNKLTDYWSEHGVEKSDEFAKLTNIIHKEWSEVTVAEHKNIKNLKMENLRDHMTDEELLFTALAELSTRGIAEKDQAKGYQQNAVAGVKGGQVANRAKKDFEQTTGKQVVSGQNFLSTQKGKKKLKS